MTPISGKTGSIEVAGTPDTNIGFHDWELVGDGNPSVDVTVFNSPKMDNGQTVKQTIFPIFDGTVNITGAVDGTALPWNAPMLFLPDNEAVLNLNLTSGLGIVVYVRVKKFKIKDSVDDAARFEGEFVITDPPTFPSNP